jgi:predicted esterase
MPEAEKAQVEHAHPERRLPPIFLFPGLAADKRLFDPVLAQVPTIRTPGWLAPHNSEALEHYAPRMAQTVQRDLVHLDREHEKTKRTYLKPSERYFIGGFSFGGMVALEMVHALFPKPAGVILLCGVRGRHQLTSTFHRQATLSKIVPGFVQKPLYGPYAQKFASKQGLSPAMTKLLVDMATTNDPDFVKWSTAACAAWKGTPRGIIASVHTVQPFSDDPADARYPMPIHHMHAEHDDIIPDVKREADFTLPNAKHLFTLTHPNEVAKWIKSIVVPDAAPPSA